jgi:formate dehydrogenase subunit delta
VTLDALVRMANQIAANQPHLSDDDEASVVAAHLRMFWTPAMREQLQRAVAAEEVDVSPVARAALGLLSSPSR